MNFSADEELFYLNDVNVPKQVQCVDLVFLLDTSFTMHKYFQGLLSLIASLPDNSAFCDNR